jgi:two-component system sensor histidine kinase QseC
VKSIRIFLVVTLMASMTLVVFLSALNGYRSSMAEVQRLFDSKLAESARLLAIAWNSWSPANIASDVAEQHAFQVWQDDKIVQHSHNMPPSAIAELKAGFQDVNFNGYRWRTFALQDSAHNRWAVVAERIDTRITLADNIILESVTPVVIALPVAGLFIWFVVGFGLSPLRSLASHLRARRADDLSPLPLEQQPVELMQVVSSTNDLLGRLAASFAREKRFASDAAHELRTPLSALKVHLHNISQGLPAGDHDLVQLQAAVDRMGNLVDKILALYRTAPDQFMARFRKLDLYSLVQQAIVTMYTEFERKHIQLELAGDGARIYGDRFALETLVKNLLDNACKYTPAGGYVHVAVSGHDAGVSLSIEDSGPGVPEDQYQRIFDRFYRLGGDQHESGVIGCGLGLAIVRHIADLHGASIELHKSDFETGLSVSVFFPVSMPGSKEDG